MKKPRYKEFDAMVEPVINTVYNKVRVVTVHPDGEEITSLLGVKELRELADYLDSLSNSRPTGADNSSSKKDCFNTHCGYHRGKDRCLSPRDETNCELRESSPS